MASWADVRAYDEVIAGLKKFGSRVYEATGAIREGANTLVEDLQDASSAKTCAAVAENINKFCEAMKLTLDLIAALEAKKEEVIEILKVIESLSDD